MVVAEAQWRASQRSCPLTDEETVIIWQAYPYIPFTETVVPWPCPSWCCTTLMMAAQSSYNVYLAANCPSWCCTTLMMAGDVISGGPGPPNLPASAFQNHGGYSAR